MEGDRNEEIIKEAMVCSVHLSVSRDAWMGAGLGVL
jgi:hypothetical protein